MGPPGAADADPPAVEAYGYAASPVSTSFPALVPFLTFGSLDTAWEDSRDASLAATKEHLERHLKECQKDYQHELTRNERTQAAVDRFLRRFLVWTRGAYESLKGLESAKVARDVHALELLS